MKKIAKDMQTECHDKSVIKIAVIQMKTIDKTHTVRFTLIHVRSCSVHIQFMKPYQENSFYI